MGFVAVVDMVSGLNSPMARLVRIEVLVLLGVAALFVLLILGSYRRQSSRNAVRVSIWVAYAASIPMVSYTLGLMQSSPYKNSLFSVWAVILFIFLGSADSLSAYRLQDNDNWKRFYFEQLIHSFWVGWLMVSSGAGSDFRYVLWPIYVIVVLKSGTRILSFKLASRRSMLSESTKWVADYMTYERELSTAGEWDPVTMRGYRYVVAGEEKQRRKVEAPEYVSKLDGDDRAKAKLVTVEQIWRCNGSLLCGDGDRAGQLKDVCLSMALSKMLNRRFAGFHKLVESELDKTHDFLFRGLLHGQKYVERAFRVIEVELAFVHDYFYTKYFVIYMYRHDDTVLSCAMIPFCGWLAYMLFQRVHVPNDELKLIDDHNNNFDALITAVLIIGVALVEGLQVYIYLASAWCKVALISKYVARESWSSRQWVANLIGCITSFKSFRSWEDKLGQYTLLKNVDYIPINFMYYATMFLVDRTKKGRKEDKCVRLSMKVKKAVIDTLRSSNGQLTNGVKSLKANGIEVFRKLSWSCTTVRTTTHTIIAWHIATTLCEVEDEERHRMDSTTTNYKDVACSLSRYCAYLVAFAPELLPDHSFVSQTIFDALVDEATQELLNLKTLEQRCEKLKEIGKVSDMEQNGADNRLIVLGARLGCQLLEIENPSRRWKVLSDFWAEMVLYLAPSDDARERLETLTRGGEFITHLWALLTHGGILERSTTGAGQCQNV